MTKQQRQGTNMPSNTIELTEENVPQRIARIARIAEIVAIIGMALIIITQVYAAYLVAIASPEIDALIRENFDAAGNGLTITTATRVATFVINQFPLLFGFWALYAARKLFRGYREGRIFTSGAADRLSSVGWAVFLLAPAYLVANTASILVLTMLNETGNHRFAISIDESDIFALVFGLLIVVVGRILHEAAILSNENKSFI